MKTAIGYARISTTDQSNFSIPGQQEYITNHCRREGIELLDIFCDKGQSAKTFDRANWKELESYVKKNYKTVDYLVVAKYDRFSRNLAEALNTIDRLEKKYKIRIISVMEPIALHPDSPYYFQFRTQMLLGADVELRVIRDRTRFGMVSAAKSGRYVACAPTGYKNTRDSADKPIIVIDEEKAPLIQRVFSLYASGMPLAEIKKEMTGTALKLKGNSALPRILTNPVYAGLIRVPAYYDDPERITKGIHASIISEGIYYQVQDMLFGRRQVHTSFNDEVPLRGLLRCECGRMITAGNSKGRNRNYWYYRCPVHMKNLSGDKLHKQLRDILKELSLPPEAIADLKDKIFKTSRNRMKSGIQKRENTTKDLTKVQEQIDSLELKYITNQIDAETYRKWKPKLQVQAANLETAIAETKGADLGKITRALDKLQDLHGLYESASVFRRQSFLRLLFGDELSYSENIYRTNYMLPLFLHKAMILKEKQLLSIDNNCSIFGVTPVSAPGGSTSQLLKIAEWLAA